MPRHCKFREGQTRIFMMETIIPSEAGYLIVSIPHFVRDKNYTMNKQYLSLTAFGMTGAKSIIGKKHSNRRFLISLKKKKKPS